MTELHHPDLTKTLYTRIGGGLIQDSTLALTEVLWLGPENANVYMGSPSVTVGQSGRILVSHDFFGSSTLGYTVQVFGSDDGGCRFTALSNVTGIYWATLFEHKGALYLLGTATDNAAHRGPSGVVISRSTDNGESFSPVSTVLPGNSSDPMHQYHTAPTPVVEHQGKLYRAFETSAEDGYGHYTAVLTWADAEADLLSPKAWARSANTLVFSGSMVPASWIPEGKAFAWQEGNAVVGPDGVIRNILRLDGQSNTTCNKAAVTRLDGDKLSFERMIDFPSGPSKFSIKRHPVSGKYYTLSTYVTEANRKIGAVFARNTLVLAVSEDLYTWKVCATLLTDDTGFGVGTLDSARYTGFHYVDWVFAGSDLNTIFYAVRTGYRGSNSYHNANRITFKKALGLDAVCGEHW